jgi:hypothetical protein
VRLRVRAFGTRLVSDLVHRVSVVPAGDPPAESAIANDGFFPDVVDPAALRRANKIGTDIDRARLQDAVLAAMMQLATELAPLKARAIAAGASKLEDMQADRFGGESRLVLLYRRALGFSVRAELIEGNRDVDMTARAELREEALTPTVTQLRQDARYAIRDMLGVPRIQVELI